MQINAPPRKGILTRRLIMDAARTVFVRDGFLNAEISEIAGEAGKSNGTFYIYFANKSDLLNAMIDEFEEDIVARFKAQDAAWHGAVQKEDWLSILTNIWDVFKIHAATFYALSQASLVDPAFALKHRALRARAVSDFEKILKRRQKSGFCKGLNAHYGALCLDNMVSSCLHDWLAVGHTKIQDPREEKKAFAALTMIFSAVMNATDAS